MLQWMATNLKSSNVLTPEELQQWQKLQENDQALEVGLRLVCSPHAR